jgi:hypothetical protein
MKSFVIEYEYKVLDTATVQAKHAEEARKKVEEVLGKHIEILDIYVQPERRQG